MSSYPMTGHPTSESNNNYPPASPTVQHYNNSFHCKPSAHQDNVFRWPHENLDKNANEKYSHHQLSRYDVPPLKNDNVGHVPLYNERDIQLSHNGVRFNGHEPRFTNNMNPTMKKDYHEQMFLRPPYGIGNYSPSNHLVRSSMPPLEAKPVGTRYSNGYNFPDASNIKTQHSAMSSRHFKEEKLLQEENKEISKPDTKQDVKKNETTFVTSPVNEQGTTISDDGTDEVKDPDNENSSTDASEKSDEDDERNNNNNVPAPKSGSSKKDGNSSQNNSDLPSYTAMIAQSILKTESNKSTLADVYEYMEKHFPSLERRGTGWRNCVRHTLSLNECFVKLHRPENGRSCNWAIHPSYYEAFTRGDYRKRRAFRKRPRSFPWGDGMMMGGMPFHREHDMHSEISQHQQPMYPFPPHHPMWASSYNTQISTNTPNHLQHFQSGNYTNNMYSTSNPYHSPHCLSPDCFCQYNKTNTRPYMS